MSYSSTDKTNRTKQIAYWNLITLSNLHSLSQTILHHPYPQLHTQTSLNWSLFFFMTKPYLFNKISTITNIKQNKNKQKAEKDNLKDQNTFISRSAQYVQYNTTTLDRLNLFKSQYHDLSIVKHQFWTRIYKLKPTSKQAYQCKRLVRNAVWKERLYPYAAAVLMAAGINKLTGIDKLKVSRKSLTFLALGIIAELMVRIKRSDKIFYSIPVLPITQLQFQRQMIIRQSMVLDGKINSYDIKPKFFEQLQNKALKQTEQEKQQILSILGYNVINKQSQI